MTNIQNHLYLFTDVKDRLPEEKKICFLFTENGFEAGFFEREIFYTIDGRKMAYDVYSFLDLSTLTTKVKAIQLAEEAYEKGYDDNFITKSNAGKKDFIQEKQKQL